MSHPPAAPRPGGSSPEVLVRYVDDKLLTEILAVAARGIPDPGFMPFSVLWTRFESLRLEQKVLLAEPSRDASGRRAESRPPPTSTAKGSARAKSSRRIYPLFVVGHRLLTQALVQQHRIGLLARYVAVALAFEGSDAERVRPRSDTTTSRRSASHENWAVHPWGVVSSPARASQPNCWRSTLSQSRTPKPGNQRSSSRASTLHVRFFGVRRTRRPVTAGRRARREVRGSREAVTVPRRPSVRSQVRCWPGAGLAVAGLVPMLQSG